MHTDQSIQEQLKNNFKLTSELTQRTLSDFHVTNTADQQDQTDIDDIRNLLNNKKYKRIRHIKKIDEDTFLCTFFDGSSSTLSQDDVLDNIPLDESETYKKLKGIVNTENESFSNIKHKIKCYPHREIKTPSDQIFFMFK